MEHKEVHADTSISTYIAFVCS